MQSANYKNLITMKIYKYNLDKSGKKFFCPKCNKRTFVKLVEFETGNYLSDEFGRCDRETNCSYHSTPKVEFINSYVVKHIPTPEPSFHNYELVSQSGRNFTQNNFVQFLKTIFTHDQVKNAILKYLIGTSKHWSGATVFWQIDQNEKVRHGKVMLFNFDTGKRQKRADGKAYISSVRSILKLENFNLNQCLFGLHLINESNHNTIAVVESEKTAVLMSIFKPKYIWVATGMKGGFKYENLKPIKNYKIIAFPDKSEFNDWHNKAIELNVVGFNINVSDWLEQTDYKEGTDLADVYIDEVANVVPERIREPTATEIIVNRIADHTPEIRLLIETFDLTDVNGNEIREN
jgi:hypothetical protein